MAYKVLLEVVQAEVSCFNLVHGQCATLPEKRQVGVYVDDLTR